MDDATPTPPPLLQGICPACGTEHDASACPSCGASRPERIELHHPAAGRNEAWMGLAIAAMLLAAGGWLVRYASMAAGAWTALSVMGLTVLGLLGIGLSTLLRPVQVWELRSGDAVAHVWLRDGALVHARGGRSEAALEGRAEGWTRGRLPALQRLLA